MRYNPSDFELYLLEVAKTSTTHSRQWDGPVGAVASVLKYCRFLQHCRDEAHILSEPEWWAMITNLVRLNGGWEVVHTLSAPYPRYSQAETEQKLRHALAGPGPHTCSYIQQQLGFTGCPLGGCGVKAPVVLGISPRAGQKAETRERHAATVEEARRRREQMQHRASRARAYLRSEISDFSAQQKPGEGDNGRR